MGDDNPECCRAVGARRHLRRDVRARLQPRQSVSDGATIAVGFVVDDAIVMLENIDRHIDDGLSPMEAAIKGAGEIGFTILSISLSLVAVFIPLFLMGGIVGRLFREFGVTVSVTILVSMLVSLTLTPMMCSRFMRSKRQVRHGRLYALSDRDFDLLLAGYCKSLDIALRHHQA